MKFATVCLKSKKTLSLGRVVLSEIAGGWVKVGPVLSKVWLDRQGRVGQGRVSP
jgi:hypothetical protein